ncbi:MAG: hypothetical protein M9894_24335 [Planctomycetes bacterium]|nr:hypothetical protein [Planctomycetota bacterium]
MTWTKLLQLIAKVCAEQGDERRVLLVLRDASYHVREVVDPDPPGKEGVLALVVYKDDPALSRRTDDTLLLCVPPDRVERLVVTGADRPDVEGPLGFVPG